MSAMRNIRRSFPDNRVIFGLKAPDAKKVQVDLVRKYDMVKDTSGFWTVTTDSISEGFHYYSLLIDGVAIADPASETFYGMGRMASGIEIPFAGGGILCLAKCAPWRYPHKKIFFQGHQFLATVLPVYAARI